MNKNSIVKNALAAKRHAKPSLVEAFQNVDLQKVRSSMSLYKKIATHTTTSTTLTTTTTQVYVLNNLLFYKQPG